MMSLMGVSNLMTRKKNGIPSKGNRLEGLCLGWFLVAAPTGTNGGGSAIPGAYSRDDTCITVLRC
jgi:hypothetical protein